MFQKSEHGVATLRLQFRQVQHGPLGTLAGEFEPIVLVNPSSTLRFDDDGPNQVQEFDQLEKIAARGRIGGLPQPRQRAVPPSDANFEQLIEGLALLFGQAVGELAPQLSLRSDTNRAAEPFDRRQWWADDIAREQPAPPIHHFSDSSLGQPRAIDTLVFLNVL